MTGRAALSPVCRTPDLCHSDAYRSQEIVNSTMPNFGILHATFGCLYVAKQHGDEHWKPSAVGIKPPRPPEGEQISSGE